jgi:hypothetical protein
MERRWKSARNNGGDSLHCRFAHRSVIAFEARARIIRASIGLMIQFARGGAKLGGFIE